MAQHAPLVSVDCDPLGTICVNHQSQVHRNGGSDCYRAARSDKAAWDRARRPKLCKLACRPFLKAHSIDLAAAAMVTGANCRLAQAHIFGGSSKAGVTRDDLSQPVHSGARRAEKGAS